MDLSKRILYFTDSFGISVNNLADRSGASQSALQKIISGESKTAHVETIEKICESLGVCLEDFFCETDEFPPAALQELNNFKDYLRWKYKITHS